MPPSAQNGELMDVPQAAAYLGVSIGFIYDWTNSRMSGRRKSQAEIIPFFRLGRNKRFRREDLDRWLDQRREGG